MKCINHSENDAVGSCQNCGRALCGECYSEVGQKLSCFGQCEIELSKYVEFLEVSMQAVKKTSTAYARNGYIYLFLGFLFLVFGILPVIVNGDFGALFLAFAGPIFIVGAMFSFKTARSIERNDNT